MFAIKHHLGGEIFVPKISSYKILDMAAAIAPECDIKIVGIRPGEKLHEEMITASDSIQTIDIGEYYAILPSVSYMYSTDDYIEHHHATRVALGFSYNSEENSQYETITSLRELIVQHVDADFQVL